MIRLSMIQAVLVFVFISCTNGEKEATTGKGYFQALETLYENRNQNGYIDDRPLIIEMTRRKIASVLEHFCNDPQSRNYGGMVFSDDPLAYADSRGSIFNGSFLWMGYLYSDFPEYYKNPDLLEKLKAHLQFMDRRQIEDGSILLGVRGLGGSNEVGFTLPALVETYKRLEKSDVPGRVELMRGLKSYILNGAACIRNKFPYTANHRWAASAGPLAMVHSIFPDERNIRHIEEYLSDGIDINADGMYYEERSPNYNGVANWGMYYFIEYYGKKACNDLIRSNLEFILEMVQPNGEAETLFSHRQDRGQAGKDWERYWQFKRMALKDHNGQYATAADMALQKMMRSPAGIDFTPIPLVYLMDQEWVCRDRVTRQPLPDVFTRRYQESPLWRFRNGAVAATVAVDSGGHWWDITQGSWGGLMRSDAVMSYHVGEAVMDIFKMNWGLGTKSFRPERITYLDDGRLLLVYTDTGWDHVAHFRPPGKWGPRRMPGGMEAEMLITPNQSGKMDVEIRISGYQEQPINLQFLLRENGELTLPDGKNLALEFGGKTFGDVVGDYVIRVGDHAFGIRGLPASQHHIFHGDQRNITGKAEDRCHRLVLGLFTPVSVQFSLQPVNSDDQ